MNNIRSYLRKASLGLQGLSGYIYKTAVDLHLISCPALGERETADVVVSLTSYGRRVSSNVVFYTLVSLLRQKVQPQKIILWLAKDEWKEDIIPIKIKDLCKKGVDICLCDDIRSYKKLIPSLEAYPESTIITFDDDVIYSKDTIETLIKVHDKYPGDIICLHAAKVIISDGIPKDYIMWKDIQINDSGYLIFPIGEGGVLYPKGCLHEDVLKKDLFMRLAPLADDVWFWFCGLRKGTIKRFVPKRKHNYSFDNLYQFFHKGTSLTQNNRFESSNDVQIRNVFDYYKLIIDSNGNLIRIKEK